MNRQVAAVFALAFAGAAITAAFVVAFDASRGGIGWAIAAWISGGCTISALTRLAFGKKE